MGNKMIDKAVNPFIQIAGARALAWGALGLLVSTVICYYAGYHYHGLLHFGPAPNPAWWCYAAGIFLGLETVASYSLRTEC